jgi:ATP-dependent Clp protease ATP-binding subunit ClpB
MYPQAVAQVFITPRLKRAIDQATEEARLLQDEYISTEHLLLGILSERGGFSATLLREARVNREIVLHAIEEGRGGQKPARHRLRAAIGRSKSMLAT